ncbi:MAG: Tryptophanyl-tRNA synthetase [uncultured Truepera sp.]|uniref:Tryptophan--tRNA ligase n=1 Tax=uncultured Truepera sp. TaxID=543023 RepID=A0A6J4VQ23_9DEIN|nr:MAG: Tryptophanyl-tRNA synthetase [uncultured Truepera sp.]
MTQAVPTPSSVTGQGVPHPARQRVFSGVQPTGDLHLGTYLGALKQWVATQDEAETIFCVVDLHALTVPEAVDPVVLREKSLEVAALYLAAGLDPEKNLIFIQSHVREHSELAWVLNCVTPLGWLYRMTQFKSKSEARESVGSGLLTYPTLMAADILLYDTTSVPVGDDQRQHVEFTRDVAARFNNLFGETFVLPNATVPEEGARVMGLDDPMVKMSKSLAVTRPGHAINLLDDEKTVQKAVMSAVTDSGRDTRFETASPGVQNLLSLYGVLTGEDMAHVDAKFDEQGYGALKKALLGEVLATLKPLQTRYAEIMGDRAGLEHILSRSADRARERAAVTMQRVRDATGLA